MTVSSSRYEAKASGEEYSDESKDVASGEIAKLGYIVTRTELVSDEKRMIQMELKKFISGQEDVLVFMGGTGLSRRDITIETVRPFFEKEIEGFGELLRLVGEKKIGAATYLSRATAGVAKGKLILCLPGSPGAAKDALRAFGKEIPHALFVARS